MVRQGVQLGVEVDFRARRDFNQLSWLRPPLAALFFLSLASECDCIGLKSDSVLIGSALGGLM